MSIQINNIQNQLIIEKIELIDTNNMTLEITKMFKSLNIVESMSDIFYRGRIIINDERNLVEAFPINGLQKIRIAWRSTQKSIPRNYIFHIIGVETITRVREPILDEVIIDFAHEDYYNMIYGLYNKSYIDKTNGYIVSDILSSSKVKLTPDVEIDTTQLTLHNVFPSKLSFINDVVRFRTDIPYVLFQRHNKIMFKSWKTLFNQTNKIQLNTRSIESENPTSNLSIKNLIKSDVLNVPDIVLDGIGGYRRFEYDIWNNNYEVNDVELTTYFNKFSSNSIKPKITYGTDHNNIKLEINSKFIEDYIKMNFVTCTIPYADSGLFVGDIVTIPLQTGQDKIEFSKYSGDFVVYRIEHKIGSDMSYSIDLVLVKNFYFK